MTRKKKLEAHPAAEVWPMLSDDELQALADSITEVGLLEPIVLTPDGLLLDGRNRAAACELAGVTPATVVYDGDPVSYIIGRNNERRHMKPGQRAMAVGVMLVAAGRRENGRWAYGSIGSKDQELNSSAWKVAMAQVGVVLDYLPELAPAVIEGAQSLGAAYDLAYAERERHDEREAGIEQLNEAWTQVRQQDPDLSALVDDDLMTVDDAIAAWERRHRDEHERAEQEKLDRQERIERLVGYYRMVAEGWQHAVGFTRSEPSDEDREARLQLSDHNNNHITAALAAAVQHQGET